MALVVGAVGGGRNLRVAGSAGAKKSDICTKSAGMQSQEEHACSRFLCVGSPQQVPSARLQGLSIGQLQSRWLPMHEMGVGGGRRRHAWTEDESAVTLAELGGSLSRSTWSTVAHEGSSMWRRLLGFQVARAGAGAAARTNRRQRDAIPHGH